MNESTRRTTAEAVRDNVRDMGQQAREAGQQVREQAREMGHQAASRVEQAATTVGERLHGAADTLREKASQEGPVARAANTVADRLDRVGTYLQDQDLSAVRGDVESLIRRYPFEALLVGVGMGYLFARRLFR
jgi:hypothetical protein